MRILFSIICIKLNVTTPTHHIHISTYIRGYTPEFERQEVGGDIWKNFYRFSISWSLQTKPHITIIRGMLSTPKVAPIVHKRYTFKK